MRFNKTLIAGFLAVQPGGWMVFDGLQVLVTGKYYGPDHPGPWASLVQALGINPFGLGVPFVIFGLAWLLAATLLFWKPQVGRPAGIVMSVATLWYLPVGTMFAIVILILLWKKPEIN